MDPLASSGLCSVGPELGRGETLALDASLAVLEDAQHLTCVALAKSSDWTAALMVKARAVLGTPASR